MMIRGLLAGLVLIAAGLCAGCGGGDGSPFEGDWVSATAGRLSFDDSRWWDGEGDSGDYSYTGDDPEYTVVFKSEAGNFERTASFLDENTFDLCEQGAGGTLVDCHQFVADKPTLH